MKFCGMFIGVTFMVFKSILAIPEDLWCCLPESGQFQYHGGNNASCWHETSNTTNPIRLTCPSFNVLVKDHTNLTVTESGQVPLTHPQLEEFMEIKGEDVCYANYTSPEQIKKLIMVCEEEEMDERILGYCMSISTVFLLLTSAVYAALPEVRDLQGKSIINFCGSMAIGLGVLSGSKVISYRNLTLCAMRELATYFFLMAAFFWSNAISVQILLSIRRPVVNSYSWKQFSWYAIYAWGCPALLTLCMAIVNSHRGDHRRPGTGLKVCWFYDTLQQWYYMLIVMAVLVSANICIFMYTSVQLWRPSFWSTHIKALRCRFVMILRMFIIMGVSWIFEMISSLAEHGVMWFIIDMFNTLQGPFIFLLLVVFRKRVVKALLKRGWFACVAGPVERYLAVKEDDEEEIIQDTIDVTMNDRYRTEINDI